MRLRIALYNFLVNRQPGIAERYHRFHDKATGTRRTLSWFYLLWINLCYYVFFCRFLGRRKAAEPYESVRLPVGVSEGALYTEKMPKMAGHGTDMAVTRGNGGTNGIASYYLEILKGYDVISFDVFDTLIFRPFDDPTDVFYLTGIQAGILDFREKRKTAERRARMKRMKLCGDMEVDLSEIWELLAADTGIPAEQGISCETLAETALCYANPVMLEIWDELKKEGRKIAVTTDMYLPKETIELILEKNGFTGYDRLFLSNEYHRNKAGGGLFDILKETYPSERIIHIGDNETSDHRHPREHGIDSILYPNVNAAGDRFRPHDMSPLIGGAYRGLINNSIYNGSAPGSPAYEYGFIYGGLFVTGYCSFIKRFAEEKGIDRILFLSRDGDILKQAYDILFPGNGSVYAYWSRKAATKLAASCDREDFFRRFLFHKTGQGITVGEALRSMELESLRNRLKDAEVIRGALSRMSGIYVSEAPQELCTEDAGKELYLKDSDALTASSAWLIRCILEEIWDEVKEVYTAQSRAAGRYYGRLCSGTSRVAAVDIGWAGSGARVLDLLTSGEWNMEVKVYSVNAGTNTLYNAEPDASESFIRSGDMVSYLYSPEFNRDLYKKHDPGRDYNVYWELLLSSPTPQFTGFLPGRAVPDTAEEYTVEAVSAGNSPDSIYEGNAVYLGDIDVTLTFGSRDPDEAGIRDIQRGILDFVRLYGRAFREYPEMLDISGRDAYAPMLLSASHGERYLKAVSRSFYIDKAVT